MKANVAARLKEIRDELADDPAAGHVLARLDDAIAEVKAAAPKKAAK